ncbi:MAG TPA: substrate-binding domain-containing protein [Gemmataceae bacterium]|nr:substrate-binding domain-containing protein [Gemmataceae bacterium]
MKRWLGILLVVAVAGCQGNTAQRPFTVGFMPKLMGIPYFNACKEGAEEAAKELGIKLVYEGPTQADSNEQINLLQQWINAGSFDALDVACNDPDLVASALRDARDKGLLVVTYDADTQPDARQFFVNMATYDAVAEAMVDAMADELEPKGTGKVGILTSSIQAPNQSEWAKRIKAYVRKKYPAMELLPEQEHGEDRNKGIAKASAMIEGNPDLKGIIGLTSVAVPAAAEAVRQEGKKGKIKVTGVSTPKDMRDYVKDGTVNVVILWNPVDLGYLTVYVTDLLHRGKMPDNGTIQAGRLGAITVKDREVLLGKPLRFTRDNIDKYDF